MTEARPVLPTDILALVSYNGQSYRNEAWTWERLGAETSPTTLGLVLDQFLAFARGRSAWISVQRQRLQGLVGARRRGGRQAWELDYLVDATPDLDAVSGLLDCAIREAGKGGAEKLFLRLDAGSDLVRVARECGFLPYSSETLFLRRDGNAAARQDKPDFSLREWEPSDSYALFRLYNATTPEVTRRSEAATFGEWHASRERRWLRHGTQLLVERNGGVCASIRAARLPQGVLIELALSEGSPNAANLVSAALGAVGAVDGPAFVLAPATSEGLALQLEDAGFGAVQEFVAMMRRTTRVQTLPKLLPAAAIAKSVGA